MKPAADAELMLYEGHNGLSITATPVGVRKTKNGVIETAT